MVARTPRAATMIPIMAPMSSWPFLLSLLSSLLSLSFLEFGEFVEVGVPVLISVYVI